MKPQLTVISQKMLTIVKCTCLLMMFFMFCSNSLGQSTGVKITKIAGIQMVSIPGGTFMMGSDKGETYEKPVHKVEISPFLIGATEITQSQYKLIIKKNPSNYYGEDSLPVDTVRWFDAVKFCNLLSEKAGFEKCYDESSWKCDFSKNGFRLPTEAEWEYACRAGTKTAYYFGDSPTQIGDYAWFGNIEIGNCDNIPHPVELKMPNQWGLFDMHGSSWEWCNDWFDEDYYKMSPAKNPKGPETGKLRVMRGGSWINNPEFITSSYRERYIPSLSYLDIGFRVVKNNNGISR